MKVLLASGLADSCELNFKEKTNRGEGIDITWKGKNQADKRCVLWTVTGINQYGTMHNNNTYTTIPAAL